MNYNSRIHLWNSNGSCSQRKNCFYRRKFPLSLSCMWIRILIITEIYSINLKIKEIPSSNIFDWVADLIHFYFEIAPFSDGSNLKTLENYFRWWIGLFQTPNHLKNNKSSCWMPTIVSCCHSFAHCLNNNQSLYSVSDCKQLQWKYLITSDDGTEEIITARRKCCEGYCNTKNDHLLIWFFTANVHNDCSTCSNRIS